MAGDSARVSVFADETMSTTDTGSSTPHDKSEPNAKPACSAGTGSTTWTAKTLTGGLLAFRKPCSHPECFPDGLDVDDVDRVVRSTCKNSDVIHRLDDDAEGSA